MARTPDVQADALDGAGISSRQRALLPGPVMLVVIYDPSRRAPASEGDFLGIISLGCLMENLWLEAEALGLGVQIVSSLADAAALKDILGIPENLRVAFSVRLGYPVKQPEDYLRVRRDVEDFTYFNRYGDRAARSYGGTHCGGFPGGDSDRLTFDDPSPGFRRTLSALDSHPRTAALRWFAGAYLLVLGISFLILPRGPINPLHGLIWFRGPAFVLCGLVVLWLAVLPMSRRAALVAHGLVAVPLLAVAAEYVHLQSYGPAVTLFLLGVALALSPLAPPKPVSSRYRPDALGIVLGLALGAQGLELLSVLGSATIPFGLQLEIGVLFTVFGFGVAACHLVPRIPAAVRYAAHLGAGASALALYVMLALGFGAILWVLGISTLLVAGAFLALPWLSSRMPWFAADSVRTRLAGGLFDGALLPLLIALPLVLAAGEGASTATKQMAFGIAIALSIAAGAAGWWLARLLVNPLSRLVRGVERIATGARPVELVSGGVREVDELAAAVQTMSATLDEQMEALTEARDQHKSVAEKLQRALQVPLAEFPGLDAAVVYYSATELAELGGDFYDVFRTASGRVGIMLGDVSGKGIDAAAKAVITRASLRAFIYSTDSPAEALSRANRQLIDTDTEGFVTVFFGVLDPISGELLYSTAGHPPPVLLSGGHAALHDGGSPVLGVFDGAEFHDTRLQLTTDDLLVLYTDGLTEAKQDGVLFGEKRLVAEVEALGGMRPADLTRALYALAVNYAGGSLSDDLAVLALHLRP